MSLILDALRRRPSERRDGAEDEPPSRTEAVLATLGYSPHRGRGSWSPKTLALAGIAALAVGFVGLWLFVTVLAPSRPATPRTAARQPSSTASTPLVAPRLGDDLRSRSGEAPAPATTSPPGGTEPAPGPTAPSPAAGDTPGRSEARLEEDLPAPQASVPASEPPLLRPSPPPSPSRVAPAPSVPPAPAPAVAAPAAPPPDHFGLALYYQRIGDFDKAAAHYRTLLAGNDSLADVHNNLGVLYEDGGRLDDATREFQRAIEIDPKNVRAHNNLGVALMRLGRLDGAAAEFRVALEADDRNVESIVNLALAERAGGRRMEAREMLQRAVTIDPRHPGAHYNLAVLADDMGDASIAVEHYRAFLRYGAVRHADLVGPVRTRLAALGVG